MLREVLNVTQNSPDTLRRWFSDSEFDLIVWHDRSEGRLVGFQLCYDLHRDEHVLTWHADRGYAHNKVDSGEDNPVRNMTPILVPDGLFERDRVSDRFAERSQDIDDEVRALVLDKLARFEQEQEAQGVRTGDAEPVESAGVAVVVEDEGAESREEDIGTSTAQRTVDES